MGQRDRFQSQLGICFPLSEVCPVVLVVSSRPDETSLEERRAVDFVEREQPPHLLLETPVREAVGRELIPEEVGDDLVGEGNGVECHDLTFRWRRAFSATTAGVAHLH